ncbi:heterogeneous nuclear ribonucleoprotein M [Contarinia nasturtii]|uniref:heterogeneous nuclear ribonucleoprotein M n=1 Tax=Contarinia nasturtii TaxID=265458 RepID=UPI0012D47AEA|nr:heterogeneous nuclear ribonucleoprotein M [Contarinia nasturtii]
MESPNGVNTAMGDVEKQRDRGRRGERGTRFSDNKDSESRDRSRDKMGGNGKRVYVSNIPYEYRWQDLKDLFRRMVGNVEYVEMFTDENGKARGVGIVEFKDPDNVGKALEVMNRYDLNGRELVVKEDHGEERDKYGRIARGGQNMDSSRGGGGGGGAGPRRNQNQGRDRDDDRYLSHSNSSHGGKGNSGSGSYNNFDQQQDYNTYGLSPSFLASLNIIGPLHTKVFVANLDYKVDAKKLKQVFKLAGQVMDVELSVDKDGNSRGFAVVEYQHPVEAVQAISMLDHQLLFDRRMTVRMDKITKEKLPDGLGGIGMGLGPNGEPLRNVALNLPSLQNQNNLGVSSNNSNAPVPVAPPPSSFSSAANVLNQQQNSMNNLAALNNVVGNLNNLNPILSTLGLGSLATNSNDTANNSALDINKIVGAGSSSGNSALNVGGGSGNFSGLGGMGSGLNQSNRLENTLSNPYSSNTFNTLSSNLGLNSNANSGFVSNQRDFDIAGSVRNYNSQSDDFGRLPSQNFGASLGNGAGSNNSNVGGNVRSQNISDTILIRNLPPNCTWQTLRDEFRSCGEVKFAEIRGQDCGVVRFSKERDAELAIKLKDGSRFDGRKVEVSFF